MLVSKTKMSLNLSGKTSYADSEFHKQLLQIIGPSLTAPFFEHFAQLNIKNLYSMPRYSQSNGQVEATNKTPLKVLKKILEGAKGK